jgi:hypothetical protein
VSPPTWTAEAAAGLTITAVAGLSAIVARERDRWLGWLAAGLLLCAAIGAAVFLLSTLPMPSLLVGVRWSALLVGAATGVAVASIVRMAWSRPAPKLADPGHVWRAMTPHEVSFLRRVWRIGFILEEDDALRQEMRPERLNATIHDLEENRRLIYLDRVRGGSGTLRAYRLTAAGKSLMTWVTHQGK